MAHTFDPFTVHSVIAGHFGLDGGVAFGVVPRALWGQEIEPDEMGRIQLVSRVFVVDHGDRRVLIDAGTGQAWDPKPRQMYRIEEGPDLRTCLVGAGIDPETITDVVISHLHWDHCGGLVQGSEGDATLTFPKATHHVQRRNWKWAHNPSEYDRRAYRASTLELLEASGRLHFIEGQTELLEGIHLIPSEGHTVGQQLVRIAGESETLLYCGDAIPTAAHLRSAWGLAYDLYPLTLIEEKKQLLAEALEESAVLLFAHDPRLCACTVEEVEGKVQIRERMELGSA
ncbi:MAG: MBL fold metallo-hydrolase [Deltaproteobacteria bacterium]|nr:MBL fold metallo-hydrolase [Deltaproteobacteria bacterium]